MKNRRESGLTLIELLITIILSGILAFAVGMILISANTSWFKSAKDVAISDDMRYAQRKIGYMMRSATTDPIMVNGTMMTFVNAMGTNMVWLKGDAVMYAVGGVEEPIVRDVKNFMMSYAVSGSTRAVTFDLTVSTTVNYVTGATRTRSANFTIKARK
jgi:prepilin-type N-terminal cleavage/methylation domain-containing protein